MTWQWVVLLLGIVWSLVVLIGYGLWLGTYNQDESEDYTEAQTMVQHYPEKRK